MEKGYEYSSDFLTKDDADYLYGFMLTLLWVVDGANRRVSFGPQVKPILRPGQIRNANVLESFPQTIIDLQARVEARYNCRFNSVECHLFENETGKVDEHFDAPPGHIAMLSVGQPRRFMVANVPQNIWETYTLAHGSLLTFFWKIRHS
ncbi:MAG: hypothetical protein DMG32_24920, partial [Acidobacteria bacterium]